MLTDYLVTIFSLIFAFVKQGLRIIQGINKSPVIDSGHAFYWSSSKYLNIFLALLSGMAENDEKFSNEEVESLASKLDEWGKGLQAGEVALLQLMIAGYGKNVSANEPEEIDTKKVRNSMREATIEALRRFVGEDKQEFKQSA